MARVEILRARARLEVMYSTVWMLCAIYFGLNGFLFVPAVVPWCLLSAMCLMDAIAFRRRAEWERIGQTGIER